MGKLLGTDWNHWYGVNGAAAQLVIDDLAAGADEHVDGISPRLAGEHDAENQLFVGDLVGHFIG